MELLMGCGRNHTKQLALNDDHEWKDLITLDNNKDHSPDVLWDINVRPLPFDDDTFDEIHSYEVLEHIGRQGDIEEFFEEFSEYWRILKPDGLFCFSVPRWDSLWAWGDPGHTRIINEGTLIFLNQKSYDQVGNSPMSDYRHLYKADFKLVARKEHSIRTYFALRANKK